MAVLYLHGVGDDGSDRRWWDLLRSALDDAGVVSARVVSPDYADILGGHGDSRPWPARTEPLSHIDHDLAERAFQIRQADLAADLGRAGSHVADPDRHAGFGRIPDPIDAVGERIIMSTVFDIVTRYVGDRPRRLAVLDRVLGEIAGTQELVIVAHSLGSLVALDLIQHLPAGIRVRLLVTAGSAIARRALPDEVLSLRHNFPHDRIGRWVNVYNPRDAVTRGRGIARRFPDVVDVAVASRLGDHNLATLMADPGIRAVVAQALSAQQRTTASRHHPGSLPRHAALELATADVLSHCADEAAAAHAPATTIARVNAARRLRIGRAERMAPAVLTRDDPASVADVLRHGVAADDVGALLQHIAAVRPFEPIRVRLPRELVARARTAAALDLGVPPSWFHDVARHGAAARLFRRPGPLRVAATSL